MSGTNSDGARAVMSMDRRVTPRLRTTATMAVVALVGGVVAWRVAFAVLSADRGLDTTDETLYLLAAEPPSRTASWNVPWGWHTRPLFVLVGEDIARFRTIGAVIVIAGGVFTGVMAMRLLLDDTTPGGRRPHRVDAWLIGAAALVGASGALMYYGDLLRTPSYNWVNLVGLLVAVGAVCALLRVAGRTARRIEWLWTGVAAFGMFVTLPAKPSSAPVMVVVCAIAFSLVEGVRPGLRRASAIVAGVVGLVALAIGTRFWPWGLGSTVARTLRIPPIDTSQRIGDAIREFVLLPDRVVDQVREMPTSSLLVLAAAVLLAALPSVVDTSGGKASACRWVAFGLGLVVALRTAAVPLPGIDVSEPTSRLLFAPATTAGLLIVVAALAGAAPWRASAHRPGRRQVAATLVLVVSPFVFGFGSANTPYRQASLAIVFLLTAAVGIVGREALVSRSSQVGLLALVAVSTAISAVTLAEGRGHVYRSGPISAMTEPIEIGRSHSTLRVPAGLADNLSEVRRLAAAAGWHTGTPMLAIRHRWSAYEPYALDAHVPESFMLTLFGYSGSVGFARYNTVRLDPDVWREAWLVLDDPATLSAEALSDVTTVIGMVEQRLAVTVPADYVCVVAFDGAEFWRPRDVNEPADQSCPSTSG